MTIPPVPAGQPIWDPGTPSTKRPDLIARIASAIATGEGFFVNGSVPNRDNNPGDLRAAPWLQHPVIAGGFWHADSLEEGIAGLYHQIALDIARGWTLRQLIYAWAPPTDGNKTENYLQETCRRTGLPYVPGDPANPAKPTSKEEPLWNYLSLEMIP